MADKILPDGSIVETNKPLFSFGVAFETAGQQTTPNLYRGVIEGTGIQFTNNSLSHSCDVRFLFDFGKILTSLGSGIIPDFSPLIDAVRAGQNDAAKLIRGAIAKIIDALRFSIKGIQAALNLDPSGLLSGFWSAAKDLIRKINGFIKGIAQYVYDISFVYALYQQIQAIIAWINSLPASIKKLVQDCLTNFTNSIKNIGTQITQVANTAKTVLENGPNILLSQALKSSSDLSANNTYGDSFTQSISDPINSGSQWISDHVSSLSTSASTTINNGFGKQSQNSAGP